MENTNKFIEFIITKKCTYNCSYCLKVHPQLCRFDEASIEVIDGFYRFLDNLEHDFEISITGGEAILHPHFFEIIEQVKKRGFKVNLFTNLSFKIETYQKIFDLLGDNLNRFDVGFHINQIQNFNLMLEKLEIFLKNKPKNTKTDFFIPLLDVDAKKENKIDKIVRVAKRNSINCRFQEIHSLAKFKKEYSDKYPSSKFKVKSFAKFCFAGCESAVIYEDGSMYRCHSSRFLKSNYLGNVCDDSAKLINSAVVCSNICCSCYKHQAYNQLCVEKDEKESCKNLFFDMINLPKMIIKNKQLFVVKIKQFFNF